MKSVTYMFLGIPQSRFDEVVSPTISSILHSNWKVDLALIGLENNKTLNSIEKVYCAYELGKAVGNRK